MESIKRQARKGTAARMLVFWINFFVIALMGRKLVGAPSDNFAFVTQVLLILCCALLVTGAIFRFGAWKGMIIVVPIFWVCCCLIILI